MSYTKSYIGKGKKVNNLDIVRVTINMEEAEAHIFTYEGKRYLRFELAGLKQADQYGKTHTAYISEREQQEQAQESKPEPKKRTRKAKAE
jgi:hypothetical protein